MLICLAVTCSGDVTARSLEVEDGSLVQWALPDKLREISGLALTTDERLLAVTDEEAIIYELDYATGHLVKAFALGDPTIRGDFEGIAFLNGMVWLMTSDGALFATREGADGERVEYERYETDLGDKCELEGLAEDASAGSLLLICKRAKKKLRVFEWTADGANLREEDIKLPEKAMRKAIDSKHVNPSGLTIDTRTGNWLVVAAQQHALFELSPDGDLIDVILRLDEDRHRQAEGIAITGDGRLLIADEGGKGQARLAIYQTKTGNNNN